MAAWALMPKCLVPYVHEMPRSLISRVLACLSLLWESDQGSIVKMGCDL